ncbi:DUF5710 domain-containing protein [Pseudonocardia abyssalis]|uniref:DUF5710 domain-containing protein n=1 Tax=Pseudonocardia abyssalis TaxID=2792008 RepID=UPI001CED9039
MRPSNRTRGVERPGTTDGRAPSTTPPAAERAGRVYPDVPGAEKDAAKAVGARSDQTAGRWYDRRPPTAALRHRAAHPPVPDLLPGGPRVRGRAVRRHGPAIVLAHQCPDLREPTGLGATPPHDHPPGPAAV